MAYKAPIPNAAGAGARGCRWRILAPPAAGEEVLEAPDSRPVTLRQRARIEVLGIAELSGPRTTGSSLEALVTTDGRLVVIGSLRSGTLDAELEVWEGDELVGTMPTARGDVRFALTLRPGGSGHSELAFSARRADGSFDPLGVVSLRCGRRRVPRLWRRAHD